MSGGHLRYQIKAASPFLISAISDRGEVAFLPAPQATRPMSLRHKVYIEVVAIFVKIRNQKGPMIAITNCEKMCSVANTFTR